MPRNRKHQQVAHRKPSLNFILQKLIYCHLPAYDLCYSVHFYWQISKLITALLLSCTLYQYGSPSIHITLVLTSIRSQHYRSRTWNRWRKTEASARENLSSPHQLISMVTTFRLVFPEITRAILLHKSPICHELSKGAKQNN